MYTYTYAHMCVGCIHTHMYVHVGCIHTHTTECELETKSRSDVTYIYACVYVRMCVYIHPSYVRDHIIWNKCLSSCARKEPAVWHTYTYEDIHTCMNRYIHMLSSCARKEPAVWHTYLYK